jgi:uncharacterized protein with ATP-grasp and redox domains/formylmethanofuran dehydrogenase subunit E
MDFHQSPPATGQWIHRRLRERTGLTDPYRRQKDRHNQLAMELLPGFRAKVRAAADPFSLAVRLAIAGNVIDLGVNGQLEEADIRQAMDGVLDEPLVGDLEGFRQAVSEATRILYLADNAGEIAFDRLLIEQLPADRVALVVRGGPIINDATLADARAVGLHEIVEVIDNGSDAPGTILEDCSVAFRDRFEQADLIIAKGQGNFETLSDVRRPIRFLLKAKCPVIARHAGVPMGTHVLLNQSAPGRRPAEPILVMPPAPSRTSETRLAGSSRSHSQCQREASMSGITIPEDLQRCIDFHGHLCPGLVVGYCAAKVGMQRLAANRSSDEEMIAIVENDSCAVDAVQVLTGCTFGKGNLFFRDYGKMVFTLAARPTGRSVRLCLRFNAPPEVDEVPAEEVRLRKVEHMLAQPPEQLFCIQEETLGLPRTARLHDSVLCEGCGEMVMVTRTRCHNCSVLCVPCAEYRISQMQ